MLLTVDIGNTRAKFGLFVNGKLVNTFHFSHDEINLVALKSLDIRSAAISSVVPAVTEKFTAEFSRLFNITPYIITHKSNFNLKVDYKTPETLGLDRLCSAEGAYAFTEGSYNENTVILTIDFGTATTINVVEYPKIFTGGIIVPGLELMNRSLNQFTKQLPIINFDDYKEIIGKSTAEAIASGIINSSVGIIDKVRSNFINKNLVIFITGGNAEPVLPYLNFVFKYEKDLVLYGIEKIYRANL